MHAFWTGKRQILNKIKLLNSLKYFIFPLFQDLNVELVEEDEEQMDTTEENGKENGHENADKGTKIFVGNLGNDGKITNDVLRPLFEKFGKVTECECIGKGRYA